MTIVAFWSPTITLAVAIALVHGLLAVFLVAGVPLAVRRPRLLRWYLLALAPTAAVNLLGQPCPLTVWEKQLWRLGGETPYRGGFISHYFVEPFGAGGLLPAHEPILLAAMVTWCAAWLLYATARHLRRRRPSTSPPAPRATIHTSIPQRPRPAGSIPQRREMTTWATARSRS